MGLAFLLGLASGGALARAADDPPADPLVAPAPPLQVAIFAGGCFWCMEPPFEKLDGVVSVTSGYTGGHVRRPTYREVSAGGTGHVEAVWIVYDPAKVTYQTLLDTFWHNVDPTTSDRQFCDVGDQYQAIIFVRDDEQRRLADESKARLGASKPFPQSLVVPIQPATEFWPAEEYHQDYYKKNPLRYAYYRRGCGRDRRLTELWGNAAPH